MKMKKAAAIILAAAVTVTAAGCGGAGAGTETDPKDASTEAQSTDREQTEEDVSEKDTAQSIAKIPGFDTGAAIEETVLIDEDDIKVTATELTYSEYSAELKLEIENNSDKDLSFIANSLAYSCNAVNGYMIPDGYFNEDVSAGKKAAVTVDFSIQTLQIHGIHSIADIQVGIYTNDDDLNSTYYDPVKIETSLAAGYDYETDTYQQAVSDGSLEAITGGNVDYWDGTQIFSAEGISIDSVALVTNKNGEQSFLIEYVNSTDQMVRTEVSNPAVNNLVTRGGLWSSDKINPGTRYVEYIEVDNLLDDDLEDLIDPGEIESLRFMLKVENRENEEIIPTEQITVNLTASPKTYEVAGNTILDKDGIKLSELGIVPEVYVGYQIVYAVENNTSEVIDPDCDYNSLSINGYMKNCYTSSGKIPAGAVGLLAIHVREEDMENVDAQFIEEIDEIEFTFIVRNEDYQMLVEEEVKTERE